MANSQVKPVQVIGTTTMKSTVTFQECQEHSHDHVALDWGNLTLATQLKTGRTLEDASVRQA